MNLLRTLGAAFGVDPTRFEAIVDAYESPGIVMPCCRLCEDTGKVGATPCPLCSDRDRLAMIEARWEERGRPDGDFAWLLGECKRLREVGKSADGARALELRHGFTADALRSIRVKL